MSKEEKKFVPNVFRILGSSTHSEGEREENDFYATDPKAVELLLELETFNQNILEGSCGQGHISEVLKKHGYNVYSSDLIDRGYGEVKNFFDYKEFDGDIITNPPYKMAQQFVEHALSIIPNGNKIAMFLKITFLEGKSRKKMFLTNPPKYVYVSSSRLSCAKNGDFEQITSSAVAYGWFVWEKGFKGDTIIRWFN